MTIVIAANLLQREIGRILSRHGITLPQWMALRELLRAGEEGISFTALSRSLMLSKAPLTGIMDRLEREGLAVRVPSRTDRRVIRAVITVAGRQRYEAVKPHLNLRMDGALTGFSSEHRTLLQDLLCRLMDDLMLHPESVSARERRDGGETR